MQPSSTAVDWIYEDDSWLLTRIQDGDHAAFAALVRRHTNRFYRVAYRFMRNQADSEDVVQDAFVKLWERPEMWQAERNIAFTTWFHRVVVNRCLDWHKKKRPLHLVDDTLVADDRESHEETMMHHQQQQHLETQIAALPERQRMALNLCFYEGLSNQEAADVMGLKLKALQSLLMRAKMTLKESMKGH
jgi:RNA polymerase sigma-70 factor (ECF subfamily)